MEPVIYLVVLAVIVIALICLYVSLYNGIVSARNRCDNAWQTIDTQLQRRNDLIPNLVETVKGYASHESNTLEEVTKARGALNAARTPQEKMDASNMLTNTLAHLFAVAESYPELKANTNFQQLQSELSDTEDKISYARMSYNDCVLTYNNAITTFPGNIVAGSKFTPRTGFEVTSEAARTAPSVRF